MKKGSLVFEGGGGETLLRKGAGWCLFLEAVCIVLEIRSKRFVLSIKTEKAITSRFTVIKRNNTLQLLASRSSSHALLQLVAVIVRYWYSEYLRLETVLRPAPTTSDNMRWPVSLALIRDPVLCAGADVRPFVREDEN